MNIAVHTPGMLTAGPEVHVLTVPGLKEVKLGDQVVVSCGPEGLGKFRVLDLWAGSIHHIPAALLEIHHDPLCRTFTGLCVMHQSVDGKASIAQGAKVTALILQREKADAIVPASPLELASIMGARKKS